VRLLLDANLSAKRIGVPLAKRGHDVRGIAGEPDLEGLDDESVLALATADDRVFVTRNSRDFTPLCRTWAEAGREHAGVILIWTLSHRQFSEIVAAVQRWLTEIPNADDWRGVVVSI
jgi:predicted nuclease of predicted toxin-antitoxin system